MNHHAGMTSLKRNDPKKALIYLDSALKGFEISKRKKGEYMQFLKINLAQSHRGPCHPPCLLAWRFTLWI